MVHGHSKFIGLTLQGTRLTPQADFNPITLYCTSPYLILTSLNRAVQFANLIMCRGHVRRDRWTDDGQTLVQN